MKAMAVIATNQGHVLIQDLPNIPGFSWFQFIEMWPKDHTMMVDDYVEYSQYHCGKFTNVKTYVSMLDNYTSERIQNMYNLVCNENDICPIIVEEDTLFHLIKIVNNIQPAMNSQQFECVWKTILVN